MAEQFATEALNTPEVSSERLRSHVDAIRALKGRAKEISDAVAFRYAEVKAEGFDKDLVAILVKRLDGDRAALRDKDDLLALYEGWYHGEIEVGEPVSTRRFA